MNRQEYLDNISRELKRRYPELRDATINSVLTLEAHIKIPPSIRNGLRGMAKLDAILTWVNNGCLDLGDRNYKSKCSLTDAEILYLHTQGLSAEDIGGRSKPTVTRQAIEHRLKVMMKSPVKQ